MFLKDAGLVSEKGSVSIREDGSGFRLELLAAGANITIMPSGEIVLSPRAGQQVLVDGNLTVAGNLSASNFP